MQSITVPTPSVILMFVSMALMVLTPIAVGIFAPRKMKKSGFAILAGFLSFFVMQILIRLPLFTFLSMQPAYVEFATNNKWLFAGFLALTAALFEEGGRWLGIRFIVRPKRYTPGNALLNGVAHGGTESLYLALTYVNNIVFALLLNSGQIGTLAAQMPAGQLEQAIASLAGTPTWMFIVGGLERVMTLSIQIGFSVVMFEGLRKRNGWLIALPFIGHAVIDFIAPGVTLLEGIDRLTAIVISEAIVLLFAAISVYLIVRFIKGWKAELAAQKEAQAASDAQEEPEAKAPALSE